MSNSARIKSIRKAHCLDQTVTGFKTFDLSQLKLPHQFDISVPTTLRLGHIAEKIVGALLDAADNYTILFENIQIIENKKTVGEIDFILKDEIANQIIHLEVAYKFYLLDPSVSDDLVNNWIGPNRKDALQQKLIKLKTKQFPLLYHHCTRAAFENMAIDAVQQMVCLMVSLYIPFSYKETLNPSYQNAVKGYYVDYETFLTQYTEGKQYYLPPKREWGIEPSETTNWNAFDQTTELVRKQLNEKQSPLCWTKLGDSYQSLFIIWW